MRILLALASLSGNTREVARVIRARCEERGHRVDWIETDLQTLAGQALDPRTYTLFLLGTWTDNAGRTPFEMKRFIAELLELIGNIAQGQRGRASAIRAARPDRLLSQGRAGVVAWLSIGSFLPLSKSLRQGMTCTASHQPALLAAADHLAHSVDRPQRRSYANRRRFLAMAQSLARLFW